MGGSVSVDYEALDGLGQRLTKLKLRLDALGRDIGAFDAAIGAPELQEILSALAASWDQSRQRLAHQVDQLAGLATAAAAQYRAAEVSVAGDAGGQPRS